MKRLGGWDAVLLYNETPNLHQHTLKVAVIDASDCEGFGFDRFRQTLARRLHLLEPLRYQLVEIPGRFHRAMWLENCDVDLDYHVRRMTISPPGGRRELDAAIGEVAGTPLDRSRPLWEFHFVEGMADNRFAIIGKVHHALADGVASANLLARGTDLPNAPQSERDDYRADPIPSDAQLIRYAMRNHVDHLKELPRLVWDTAKGVRRVRRKSTSTPGLARNFHPPATFLNHVVSPGRTFASATLELDDVKATGKHLGVTINDMVLAISTGALRTLLLKYDGHADEPLLCGVPMSIDTSPERISGNALGTVLVSLPTHVSDPLEWVRLSRIGAMIGKENTALLGPELVSRWASYAPPALTEWMFRRIAISDSPNRLINVPVSNVPGPQQPARIDGAPIEEFLSVGPLTFGVGVNITVWSYVGKLNISVLADDATFDDPHEVTRAMVDAFAHIRQAAGLPAEMTP
ncbi:wax ester/triacylglycerol synthase family O-acyltransferase [Mycolicibacterium duvalii]|uniref:WS/DGAT/MGAT family O-acyltransferase n=1 Tax=Mycolicibacterium duvalii TaxID=39688 RepID=UPI000BEEE10A|nr:wax ester/triacylglycerol synthase family O-acyltransferase [Mycolicibacterium duvalii]MCV7370892.1 wax ester/triacylglycerol synthase family O-acyltransferase [Mycolicibacterium duvalii]PEG41385.1 wax ester/triacylglycerol synthase family O-acyltransferase [Mycolicibacterium duvalii]